MSDEKKLFGLNVQTWLAGVGAVVSVVAFAMTVNSRVDVLTEKVTSSMNERAIQVNGLNKDIEGLRKELDTSKHLTSEIKAMKVQIENLTKLIEALQTDLRTYRTHPTAAR
jgi:cell shape-determining protein MreC